MNELISKLNGSDLTVFIFVTVLAVLGAVVAVIALIMYHWRRVHIAEMETALKEQMLAKGMSAADIVQVLTASRDSAVEQYDAGKDFTAVRSELVQSLVEQEMPAADIELVLQAMGDHPDDTAKKADMIRSMTEQGMTGADIARVVRALQSPKSDMRKY
jgi:hypothetical protein